MTHLKKKVYVRNKVEVFVLFFCSKNAESNLISTNKLHHFIETFYVIETIFISWNARAREKETECFLRYKNIKCW